MNDDELKTSLIAIDLQNGISANERNHFWYCGNFD